MDKNKRIITVLMILTIVFTIMGGNVSLLVLENNGCPED